MGPTRRARPWCGALTRIPLSPIWWTRWPSWTPTATARSFEEFSRRAPSPPCWPAPRARPGVVQVHASCPATTAAAVYQSWNELYEHTCRAVNGCEGWSCVETAGGPGSRRPRGVQGRDKCDHCHSAATGKFSVKVPPGEDRERLPRRLLGSDAPIHTCKLIIGVFGIDGATPEGTAYANMPGSYHLLARSEMGRLIAYLRTLTPEGDNFEKVPTPDLIDPGN